MRIVIVGHAASPDRGSEPGQSWNWAWYLSQDHDVWLVNFPEFRDEVDRFLAAHPNSRLHVVWVDTPRQLDPWDPARSSTGIRFKIHYMLWLFAMSRVVADLVRREAIDLVHQVGLITVSAPSKLWRLPVPFVWGPLGGGETAPVAFRSYYGKDWGRERGRRLRLRLIARSPGLRGAVRHTGQMLAVNQETTDVLLRAGASEGRTARFMDAGVRPDQLRAGARAGPYLNGLTLLWVGRLEARKALPILLDALALLPVPGPGEDWLPLRLLVAGEGPKLGAWQEHAQARGLKDCVTFLGAVAPLRMAEVYDEADVFVFTSLQDAFGSVVIEAMSRALPAIVLNHHGCATVVPDDAAIKIAVTTPAETIAAFAAVLDDIRRRPEQLAALSERALAAAQVNLWPNRASMMTRIYDRLLQKAT